MSLGPTFFETAEGIWFDDSSIIYHPDWFVCWDEDDPIEIVVKKNKTTPDKVISYLIQKGWKIEKIGKSKNFTGRCFSHNSNSLKLEPAVSCFIRQLNGGPPAGLISGEPLPTKPKREGTYYMNSKNGNGGYV